MIKVSVIMPSLNVGKYIDQCIRSVVEQTLEDIEIICVDAGSTDGTLEILREYAAKDDRVKVVLSDRKSYGYQMNLGISMAEGEYIGIVETDDYIDSRMFETLYELAVRTDADYVKGNAENFEKIYGIERTGKVYPFTEADYDENGMMTVDNRGMTELILKDYYLWSGIYKRNLIKKIRFNETPGAAYQDVGFLMQTFMNADKAVYINKPFYHYRQDNADASCYNKKAFKFVAEEYDFVESLIAEQSTDFKLRALCKMYRQTRHRINIMAHSGIVWDNAAEYLSVISRKAAPLLENSEKITEFMRQDELDDLRVFVNDPMALYEQYRALSIKNKQLMQEFIDSLRTSESVVIFGAGSYGRFVHLLLQANDIHIKAYCDNSDRLWNGNVQGASVLSPAEACIRYPDAAYVVANKYHSEDIKAQLEAAGIKAEQIIGYNIRSTDMNLLRKL